LRPGLGDNGAVRHLRSILALPFVVMVVIPALLLWWRGAPYLASNGVALVAGAMPAALGLAFVVWTIALFATRGRGTLAPWDPPAELVVVGPYRRVRNPMIFGVMAVLMGEALLTWSLPLAIWSGVFTFANALYIPWKEEPALLARFGEDYARYARNVPPFAPRTSAWDGRDDGAPRRSVDDLPLVGVPADQVGGVLATYVAATAALFWFLAALIWTALADGPGPLWLLVFGVIAWALLDVRDARLDILRAPPPDDLFGRLHEDGRTFELRDAPDGRPVAGWRFIRRDKGAFILMRPRIASRALVKRHRPKSVPFRMATLYEPRGKPDEGGWIRYPAAAVHEEPPGEWRSVAKV